MQASASQYMTGFGGHFESEAVEGALPKGRNSPQRPPFGLYAEQLSGTAFTAPRHENRRSWLYRMRPTADHPPFSAYGGAKLFAPGTVKEPLPPNRLRWDPPADLPAVRWFPAADGLAAVRALAAHLTAHPDSMSGQTDVVAELTALARELADAQRAGVRFRFAVVP